MKRREFITLLGSATLASPLAARAQQSGKVHRVGILWLGTLSANAFRIEAFRQGLRELGYVEDRNIVIVSKGARANFVPTQLTSLVEELAREKVEIILTDEAPRVHHATWQRDSGVAASRASAAVGQGSSRRHPVAWNAVGERFPD